MIVFDLLCRGQGEIFEAWFQSNDEFERQNAAGMVQCPVCGSADVGKAPMAPSVTRKAGSTPLARLAAIQAAMLKDSRWVGDQFADRARAMHSGEVAPERVHGQATLEQARALVEDGVPVAPLPLPVTPPNQVN